MSVGTSAVVYPAASLVEIAAQNDCKIAIVNPNPTDADPLADFVIRGEAGNVMPRIIEATTG